MAIVIADSDVLIDFLRGNTGAKRVREGLQSGNLCTTTISAFELLFGANSRKQLVAIETLLDSLQIFELSSEAVSIAAKFARELEQEGVRIGMADYLIAGVCVERSAKLMTNNVKHFERIKSLRLY